MRHALRPAIIAAVVFGPAAAFAGPAIHHIPRKAAAFTAIPLPHPGGRSAYNPGDPLAPKPHARRHHRHHHHYGVGGYPYDAPQTFVAAAPAVYAAAPPPPLRPRSFNVADPTAHVARTPSGRIIVSHPAGFGGFDAAMAHPYAPPSIQIIGAPSARHMRGPVHLGYGVQPPEGLPLGPKVVWLKEPSRAGRPLKGAE